MLSAPHNHLPRCAAPRVGASPADVEPAIPVVDLQGLQTPGLQAKNDAELLKAAETVGFVLLRHAPFPVVARRDAFAAAQLFFARPTQDKLAFEYRDTRVNHGYVACGQEALDPLQPADHKESFTMRDVQRTASRDGLWPDSAFRQAALAMDLGARFLSATILASLGRSLGVEPGYFERRHSGENQTLRFLHYPPASSNSSGWSVGAGAHTDYGSLTLLWQDGRAGLEVQRSDGTWQRVPADPRHVVLNIGDLLERWTEGRLRSARHRVRPQDTRLVRSSIAFFCDPDDVVEICTLPSCRRDGAAPMWSAVMAGVHIASKLSASYDSRTRLQPNGADNLGDLCHRPAQAACDMPSHWGGSTMPGAAGEELCDMSAELDNQPRRKTT